MNQVIRTPMEIAEAIAKKGKTLERLVELAHALDKERKEYYTNGYLHEVCEGVR